jgi:hypothetical protein
MKRLPAAVHESGCGTFRTYAVKLAMSAHRGIVLQNSFGIDQHKFSGPYVRRTNNDLRDYVIL